jgi:hypothetical protein
MLAAADALKSPTRCQLKAPLSLLRGVFLIVQRPDRGAPASLSAIPLITFRKICWRKTP